MQPSATRALLALFLLASLADGLRAQGGASVHNQSACTAGRGGATVASPCRDGSAVFYNPAALAMRPGRIGLGSMFLFFDAEFRFDRGGTANFEDQFQPIPHLYANYRPTDRLALAVGAWAPYGLATEWPLSFEGRFVGYDNTLATIYIQPTVAYAIVPDRLSVGAGLDVVYGDVEINRRIDLGVTPPFDRLGVPAGTDFADLKLEGDDWALTGQFAVAARLSDRVRLGARYVHAAELGIDDGRATFTPVPVPDAVATIPLPAGNPFGLPAGTPIGAVLPALFEPRMPLADQGLATRIELPNQFAVGLAYRPTRGFRILGEYQWTGWSTFDRVVLDFAIRESQTLFLLWNDTHTFRLGAEYQASETWTVRGGWLRNDAAEPAIGVSPLLPEAERNVVGGGVGYDVSDRFRVDAGAVWALQDTRRGRVQELERPDVTPAEVNVGVYEAGAFELGLTLSYRFGTER